MADFPYTLVPNNLQRFFKHIQSAGVPNKVGHKYLQKAGFKSTNDRAIISVLKFLGFVDSSGSPTGTWKQYRDKSKAEVVLANAIRKAYSDLFITYPEANRKDSEALRNYFSANTSVGERALSAIVDTFKSLCSLADFTKEIEDQPEDLGAEPRESTVVRKTSVPTAGLTVNINIQLQLPVTEDATIYDRLFAALKKHLIME